MERDIFDRYDVSHTGTLSFEEFKSLLLANTVKDPSSLSPPETERPPLSERELNFLWTKFDRLKDGVIHFDEEFAGRFDKVGDLLKTLQKDSNKNTSPTTEASPRIRMVVRIFYKIESIVHRFMDLLLATWQSEDRIYFVFILWVVLGVTWYGNLYKALTIYGISDARFLSQTCFLSLSLSLSFFLSFFLCATSLVALMIVFHSCLLYFTLRAFSIIQGCH